MNALTAIVDRTRSELERRRRRTPIADLQTAAAARAAADPPRPFAGALAGPGLLPGWARPGLATHRAGAWAAGKGVIALVRRAVKTTTKPNNATS